jgi:hypothetical protein
MTATSHDAAVPLELAWRLPLQPLPRLPTPLDAAASLRVMDKLLHAPFDALRSQYARAVRCGWAPRSMLASRDFDNGVDALEHLVLGPLARSV